LVILAAFKSRSFIKNDKNVDLQKPPNWLNLALEYYLGGVMSFIQRIQPIAIGLILTTVIVGCNHGGSGAVGGQNGVGPTIVAKQDVPTPLFSQNGCLSGVVNFKGSGWYLSGDVTITSNCTQTISLQESNLSFTSQAKTAAGDNVVPVAISSLSAWWVNNDQYNLKFSLDGNQLNGVIRGANTSATIAPKQSIKFEGGINLPSDKLIYDYGLANSSLLVGDSKPESVTGSLEVTVNSESANCGVNNCNNLTVDVKNALNVSVATITVPAANVGAKYTQAIAKLKPGQYHLGASNVPNVVTSYVPSAEVNVTANTTSNIAINYVTMSKTGSAKLTVPQLLASYTGKLNLDILNSKESDKVVASYQVAQGQTVTTSELPISDSQHGYSVRIQGVADPVTGKYYVESGLPTLVIRDKETTNLTLPFKLSTEAKRTISFNISGLAANDRADLTLEDAAKSYVYPSYANLANGSKSLIFEANHSLGYSLRALSGNYQQNPLTDRLAITTDKSISLKFESEVVPTPTPGGATVAGWPNYLAMGAVGGPNTDSNTQIYSGGDDSFGNKPVDAVFKYAGVNGNGDPGVIDPPMNAIRMTQDLTKVSEVNDRASRVVIVEYTGEMSGGQNYADFTNTSVPNPDKQSATYIMARHFISLAADAQALYDRPVIKNGVKYYGSLIMNPDLLGAMQQNNYVAAVNQQLAKYSVNTAVDQALCVLTNERSYTNNYMPNGDGNHAYKNKTYKGTPYQILSGMLADNYPAWSISSLNDPFWNTAINNHDAKIGEWFDACVTNPSYDRAKYAHPTFPATFDGWVQANNWLIRKFAPKSSGVTFGWQENMWAVNSGFWLHTDLTQDQINAQYATPVANWLRTNAPSAISNVGHEFAPDYFVFDRYETDDSAGVASATLYNARSWDNFVQAVGAVSRSFNNIPVMLWQIPGSHLPYVGETNPQYFNNQPGSYIFSSAPVYFFGDSKLRPDLSNLIKNPTGGTANQLVGSLTVASNYNCPGCDYQKYLLAYGGKNFDWSRDNQRLAFAAANNVFAILWGGGNTTNVIKNFSNPDDHGWLANKIKTYYQNPQLLK
jgi:hypothetical protein